MNLKQPRFWYKKNIFNSIISKIFLFFSLIYLLLFFLRKIRAKKVKLNKQLITIGNIVVGGSGKTPAAIKIKQIIDNNKLSSVFLTRGYKGNLQGPIIINKNHNIKETGDEALLLSSHGKVIIAKKRHEINDFLKTISEEYLILDDGLQNPHIQHDTKIAVIDEQYLFGNKYFLPAGPLRCPIKSTLEMVDIILLIGNDYKKNLPNDLLSYDNKIYRGKYKVIGAYNKKQRYYAFSALANNDKFFNSLKKEGLLVNNQKSFPDHHYYSEAEILKLKHDAKNLNLKLITTSKDMVKIPIKYQKEITEFKIELELMEEQKFTKKLLSCLKK